MGSAQLVGALQKRKASLPGGNSRGNSNQNSRRNTAIVGGGQGHPTQANLNNKLSKNEQAVAKTQEELLEEGCFF